MTALPESPSAVSAASPNPSATLPEPSTTATHYLLAPWLPFREQGWLTSR